MAANTVTIYNTSGSDQANIPVSVGRPCAEGEMVNVSSYIGATPITSQANILNRWPDGTVKYVIMSFVIPSISSGGSVTVGFGDGGSPSPPAAPTNLRIVR